MNRKLPVLAIVLGLAGLIPFIACGVTAAGGNGAAPLALVAYGAVILAFLGGVHWGFALGDSGGRAERARLGLGVVPSLVGWAALLIAVLLGPDWGISLLIAGFVVLTVVEGRASRLGLMPGGYMWLRWVLSGLVILTLVATLALRLSGARIVTY